MRTLKDMNNMDTNKNEHTYYGDNPSKKLFRDPDDKKIAGVCSGLAIFFNLDVVLIRTIFLITFIFGSTGLWVYLVIWIAVPLAKTAREKCQLRGIPPTPENLARF